MSVEHEKQEQDASELLRVRARMHRLADQVQSHEMKIAENALHIGILQDQTVVMATRDQLSNVTAQLTLKLEHLATAVTTVQNGINWAIGLILSAVGLAVLSLILRQP